MTGVVQFKYGTIYREVIRSKKKDWCKGPQADTSADAEFRQVIKIFKAGAPEAVHDCPFNEFLMKNFTFDETVMESVFPTGDYKLLYRFWDINEASVFNFTAVTTYKSSYRETFG